MLVTNPAVVRSKHIYQKNQRNEIRKVLPDYGLRVSNMSTVDGFKRLRILIGLIMIAVFGLIITASILLSGSSTRGFTINSKTVGAPVSLEGWIWGFYVPKKFNGTWISDDEIFYRDLIGNLIVYNVKSTASRTILDATYDALRSSVEWKISADGKYVLLASNYQRFFRHSYWAQYRIVNLKTLDETLLQSENDPNLELALWAPEGNGLVYVSQNNIYYRPAAEIDHDYQITTNGVFGTIYNGIPDWVYEEEILCSKKALWFSPNGNKLAFAYFDDTKTRVMNIPFYGKPGNTLFQYTGIRRIHYPKPGTVNPSVKLYYVDLERVRDGNVTLNEIEPPSQLANVDRILVSVVFATDKLISSTWMNRVQNKVYFNIFDVETSSYNTAFSYAESDGWVKQFEPHFGKDGTAFLLIHPQKQSDGDYWHHLVMITGATGPTPKVTALTSGKFVVTEIVSWDQDNSQVYYLATNENDSGQQHLYRIGTTDANDRPECLSCNVRLESDGTRCLYNTATFSKNNSHYILTCSGPGVPEVSIYESTNARKLLTWESNKPLAYIMAKKSKPLTKKFTVPVAEGFEAQVRLILPPGADLSGATKYPMMVNVYGAPDTNRVNEKFDVDWGNYLATNKNVIYASIDGRGSGLKGNSILFAGYRNLGTVEIFDQINVTRYVQDHFPFVDRNRTAIWGWSYGGYAAAMSLAMDSENVFKCGIAVAPVTDWLLYDSMYTERFMGLPTVVDNLAGYERAQLLNKAANIKPNSLYLIHGTFDDNVHHQQSLMLAKVLEQKDILFRQQTYTDEDHSLIHTRLHLYHSLENFLNDCFRHSV